MKSAIIYVFSGTGNTLKIAKLYQAELEKKQINTQIYNITSDLKDIPQVEDYDYIGFAYPVHAFNAPKIILDFAKILPQTQNKEFFIFSTAGEALTLNNSSSNKLIAILRKKGYLLTNEYLYVMPYNMIFRHSDTMAYKMSTAAQKVCPVDVKEILSAKKSFLKKSVFGNIISFILRIEQPGMRLNGKFFKVDYDRCINCQKCVKNCPTYNIKYIDDKYVFGNKCIMCSRCSMNCSKDAINIAILNSWKVNGPYSFKDPSAEKSQPDKRDNYCKKAYERYFEKVDRRVNEE